jgi:hypothetical protein
MDSAHFRRDHQQMVRPIKHKGNMKLGIKEQVKRGLLSIADAMNRVDPKTKTYGWLKRRLDAKVQVAK